MKIADINRKYTEIVSNYISRGYTINPGTMSGSQGEVAHTDLTNGNEIVRVLIDSFIDCDGTALDGYEIIVGISTDYVNPNAYGYDTIWNNRLNVVDRHKFYSVSVSDYPNEKSFFGTKEDAQKASDKLHERRLAKLDASKTVHFTGKALKIAESVVKRNLGIKNVSKSKLEVFKTFENGKNRYFVQYRSTVIEFH